MLIAFGFLYMMVYNIYLKDEVASMENTIDLIETDRLDAPNLVNYLKETGSRLTIINPDGNVEYDSRGWTNANHAGRQEVQQALESGIGDSIRYSATLDQTYLYTAKLDTDTGNVIRLSKPFDGVGESMQALMPYFLMAFFIGVCVAWFLSSKMAQTILAPIREIADTVRQATVHDERLSFKNYKYPELQEITTTLTDMDEQIHNQIDQIERDKQSKQDFFSNASHELKTPLTSIIGYSELVRTGTITGEDGVNMCLDQILQESNRMQRLIGDILTLSKLENKGTRNISHHIYMPNIIDRIVQSLTPTNKLDCEITVSCEPLMAYWSEEYLEMILINLLSNALKYNKPNGTVDLKVKEDEGKLFIQVSDTGVGMAQKDLEHIFERFYRADKERSATVPGTGLGMSIVKSLIDTYNGTIECESEENVGTTFRVWLPILINSDDDNPQVKED
jgi:two-component system phosphate regulon sensor histidine kinase PhoR